MIPSNKKEIIYQSSDGAYSLCLEKAGNVMHLYTRPYTAQGVPEGFVIPEEYRKTNSMQMTGLVYSDNNPVWVIAPVQIKANGEIHVQGTDGKQTTNYKYVSFDFVWLV